MRITSGILSIFSGVPILFIGIFVSWMGGATYIAGWGAATIAVTGVAWFAMGILAIIGGAVAIAGKAWVLALVGAICTVIMPIWFYQAIIVLLPILIMGALATFFAFKSRSTFA